MQKINFILLLLIISSGCSVLRNGGSRNYINSDNVIDERIEESIRIQNLSSKGFYIQKAEIEYLNRDGSQKLLANIKFESPDKYLISLKSKAGIEAARIFITKDTVLINDRINKKLYYSEPDYLKRKYGIAGATFPLVFGDYIGDKIIDGNEVKCFDGKIAIINILKGVKINYVIDCRKGKIVSSIIENSLNKGNIEIKYSHFFKVGNILIPEDIDIIDLHREISVKVKIDKIEVPWKGNIEFVPGNNYEILQLR